MILYGAIANVTKEEAKEETKNKIKTLSENYAYERNIQIDILTHRERNAHELL